MAARRCRSLKTRFLSLRWRWQRRQYRRKPVLLCWCTCHAQIAIFRLGLCLGGHLQIGRDDMVSAYHPFLRTPRMHACTHARMHACKHVQAQTQVRADTHRHTSAETHLLAPATQHTSTLLNIRMHIDTFPGALHQRIPPTPRQHCPRAAEAPLLGVRVCVRRWRRLNNFDLITVTTVETTMLRLETLSRLASSVSALVRFLQRIFDPAPFPRLAAAPFSTSSDAGDDVL